MKGKFITLEGTEGAGKSTALKFIENILKRADIPFIKTREPGGTPIAEEIRKVLLFPTSEKIEPLTELLLMFASRAELIHEVILPALSRGDWVISDRFVDASFAYQGGGRELNEAVITLLDKLVVADCQPHLTLLLDLPVEVGLARTKNRDKQDRIEAETVQFFERVREAYLKRASREPHRIKIINANQSYHKVESQIEKFLQDFIKSNLS